MFEQLKCIFLILSCSLINCFCNSDQVKSKQISKSTFPENHNLAKPFIDDSLVNCELIFDTISDEKYIMHQIILDKFNNIDKRGYFFNQDGDTLNKFLYHKDIAEFIYQLDSSEKGIYKIFTNKIVFLILENEPKMLDIGLTGWIHKLSDLDYFFDHISNPLCNTISVDSLSKKINIEMSEKKEVAKIVKKIILKNLKKNEYDH